MSVDPLGMELLNAVYADKKKIILLEQTLVFKDMEISNLKTELLSSRNQVDQVLVWEDQTELEVELRNLKKLDKEKSTKIEVLENHIEKSLMKEVLGLRIELEELRKLKLETPPNNQNGGKDASRPAKGQRGRKRRCSDAFSSCSIC